MSDPNWHHWPVAIGLTLAFEAPVVLWWLRRLEPHWGRRIAWLLGANLLTHPLVWFFFPRLPLARPISLALSEAWAMFGELLFYALVLDRSLAAARRWRVASQASVLANLTSWALGALLLSYFGHLL